MEIHAEYRRRRMAARLRAARLALELEIDTGLHRVEVPPAIAAKIVQAGRLIESAAYELDRSARTSSKRRSKTDTG